MSTDIPGTMLLDPRVIDDPYPFYRRLHAEAPVWKVPGTEVCIVSSFALVVEATGRVDDFSSSMHYLLYRGDHGLPARLAFGEGTQVLAVADPPVHTVHRKVVFPELMARRMSGLEAEVTEVAERCIDLALNERPVDFMATVGERGADHADHTADRLPRRPRILATSRLRLNGAGRRKTHPRRAQCTDGKECGNLRLITEQLAAFGGESDGDILDNRCGIEGGR